MGRSKLGLEAPLKITACENVVWITWLRLKTSGGLFWTRERTFRALNRRGISWPAVRLSSYQKGFAPCKSVWGSSAYKQNVPVMIDLY